MMLTAQQEDEIKKYFNEFGMMKTVEHYKGIYPYYIIRKLVKPEAAEKAASKLKAIKSKKKPITDDIKTNILKCFNEFGFDKVKEVFGIDHWHETLKTICYPEYRQSVLDKGNKKYVEKYNTDDEFRQQQLDRGKEYRNSDKGKEYARNYRIKNINSIIKRYKNYYKSNIDKFKNHNAQYFNQHKDHLRICGRERFFIRYNTDPLFRLKESIRGSVRRGLNAGKLTKNERSIRYLGCSIECFKDYIEKQFQPGMSWDNQGGYYEGCNTWQLDHIIPLSTLKDINDELTIKKVFHYTNYRPIWAKDNQIKKARAPFDFEYNNLDYSYTVDECIKEYAIISSIDGRYDSIPNLNKIVLTYQPHFYKVENELWLNPEIKRFIIENRCQYLCKQPEDLTQRELLRGFKISGKYIGYSHFSPLWIKAFIKEFNIKSIYDPCGGWGHRLLGAGDITYIYNDINKDTYEGIKAIIKDFNIPNKIVYNNPAESFTPVEDYEAVFTCPPYFNKEIYGEVFNTYEKYLEWWNSVVVNSSKTAKYFAVVINQTYKKDIINITEKYWKLIKDIPLKRIHNHFNTSINATEFESLLVFTK